MNFEIIDNKRNKLDNQLFEKNNQLFANYLWEDNIEAVISSICQVLHELNGIEFNIRIDEKKIYSDISSELAIALEQFQELLEFFSSSKREFTLDFYEQGNEFKIGFIKENKDYTVKTFEKEEVIPIVLLHNYFETFFHNFNDIAVKHIPKLYDNRIYIKWKNEILKLFDAIKK